MNVPSTLFEAAHGCAKSQRALTAEERELFRGALSHPAAIDAGIAWYRANVPPFDAIAPGSGWPSRAAPLTMPVLLIQGSETRPSIPTSP